MELCDHLKKYYKSEILNGNDVLSVDVNYYEKIILAIHFTKPLSEKNKIKIHEDNCVETEDILLPFWPSQTYIYIVNRIKWLFLFHMMKTEIGMSQVMLATSPMNADGIKFWKANALLIR